MKIVSTIAPRFNKRRIRITCVAICYMYAQKRPQMVANKNLSLLVRLTKFFQKNDVEKNHYAQFRRERLNN